MQHFEHDNRLYQDYRDVFNADSVHGPGSQLLHREVYKTMSEMRTPFNQDVKGIHNREIPLYNLQHMV